MPGDGADEQRLGQAGYAHEQDVAVGEEREQQFVDDLILEEDPPLPVDLTASLGVAFFREDGDDPKTLMRSADRALYTAKRLGRNRVVLASEASEANEDSPAD